MMLKISVKNGLLKRRNLSEEKTNPSTNFPLLSLQKSDQQFGNRNIAPKIAQFCYTGVLIAFLVIIALNLIPVK